MYGYFRARYQKDNGKQIPNATIKIRRPGTTTPAEIRVKKAVAGVVTLEPITPAEVTTDSNGFYEFYALPGFYRAKCDATPTTPGFDFIINVPAPMLPLADEGARPPLTPGSSGDDTTSIQAEIDLLTRYVGDSTGKGGVVRLRAGLFKIGTLVLYPDVSLEGDDTALTVLQQKDDHYGPAILVPPSPGSGQFQPAIKRLLLQGGELGTVAPQPTDFSPTPQYTAQSVRQ